MTSPRHGYKLIVGGRVIPAPTLAALGSQLADAYRKDQRARASACETLTSDRRLTAPEQAELVDIATRILLA